MAERRYRAMMLAVDMARSGRFNNWWAIAARLRVRQHHEDALDWTDRQKQWLDMLCGEARSVSSTPTRGGIAQ